MNQVILLGNLGRDPELSYTNNKTAVAKLAIATSERRKDGDQWKEHTEWHRVIAWGHTAENAQKYLQKGSKVLIVGRIQSREFKNKQGVDTRATEIVANEIRFLDGRSAAPERSDSDDEYL